MPAAIRRAAMTLALCASTALATESVTYRYDERGRLTQVSRTGTINNGVVATYGYDKADNRTNVTVVTGGNPGESPPSFSIGNTSAGEGQALIFTVNKTGTVSSAYSVNYATANGTATAGSDYAAVSGTLLFGAAETSKSITVTTIDDSAVEAAETVLVNLSGASGGSTISASQGDGTINDNDVAPACNGISFTVASNASVTEGANSSFTVTKAGTTPNSCAVSYATSNGSAIAGSDYTSASGVLTFGLAQTVQTVTVSTIDDMTVESPETFGLNLASPSAGATLGTPNAATATINDNDAPPGPSFSINDSGATEGFQVAFTITKTGSTSNSYSVSYYTSNDTATAGPDYQAVSGTVTFGPSETTKTIYVGTSSGDQQGEGDETFFVTLHNPTPGATISDATGVGTISDEVSGCTDPVTGLPVPCGEQLNSTPPDETPPPDEAPPPDETATPGEKAKLSGEDE